MTARARVGWRIAAGAVSVLVLGVWLVAHPRTRDPYPFLAGHRVRDVAVQGPGSWWGPSECRTYSWKQSWRTVAEAARRELPGFGMTERPDLVGFPEGALWVGEVTDNGLHGVRGDPSVWIISGRIGRIGYRELSDKDPEWVTVLVQSDLDDNWITILRYTFFPMGD